MGPALMGRVLNALGEPIDEGPRRWRHAPAVCLSDGAVRSPLDRVPIRAPLGTGIRVIDALLTVGRGQRVGIFGGSGVGKSTLIGMMTRNTEADVTVVGLVGERGREVGEFLEDSLGEEGRARSVVVVSTSDQSPLHAHAGGAGRDHGGRVLCRPGQARAAGARFAHPLRHGGAGDRPGGRRAAHGQGLYALGVYAGWRGWSSGPGSSARARSPPSIPC